MLAVTCIDLLLGTPRTVGALNTLRLGVLCPLLVVLGVAISVPAAQRYYTEVVAVGVTLIGFVVTYIAHLGALGGSSYVLAGLVLVVLYGCLFLGLLFNVAIAITCSSSLRTSRPESWSGLPLDELYYSTAILGGAAVIGGISTYNLEHALRTNFLETRPLERARRARRHDGPVQPPHLRRLHRTAVAPVAARRTGVAIIFIDIDYFKVYNDLYGHQAGDDCLKRVAQCIARGAKRPFDFAARYGGEEFVLVLYGPPDDYVRTVARADSQRRASSSRFRMMAQVAKHRHRERRR